MEKRHELQVKTRDNLAISRDMTWSFVTRVTCVTPFSAVKRSSVLGESWPSSNSRTETHFESKAGSEYNQRNM